VSLLGSGHRGTRIGAPVVRLRGRREVVQAEARGEVSGPPWTPCRSHASYACVAVSLILKVSLHLAVCGHTQTDSAVGAHELKLPPRYDICQRPQQLISIWDASACYSSRQRWKERKAECPQSQNWLQSNTGCRTREFSTSWYSIYLERCHGAWTELLVLPTTIYLERWF